jgi:hypothetical protein
MNQTTNRQQLELLSKIEAFEIDESDSLFPYSLRLSRDQQWSQPYTQRVIAEYKKFLFLAMTANHPVTPSGAIDNAWHLHLIYTRSYWDDLCGGVLNRPLHHRPSKGGNEQYQKFCHYYSQTLASYESFFGYPAPADIWPDPNDRFQQASKRFWSIRKPNFLSFGRWYRFSGLRVLSIGLITLGLNSLLHPIIMLDLPAMAETATNTQTSMVVQKPTPLLIWAALASAGFFMFGVNVLIYGTYNKDSQSGCNNDYECCAV